MKIFIITLVLLMLSRSRIVQCQPQSLTKLKSKQHEQEMMKCLQSALRQGNINLLKQINPLAKEMNKQLLIKKYEEELLRLDMLQDDIILEQSTCEPILKWSQNNSHIFISMKTSHRWDSPPCLYSKNQSSYLNQSYFYYSNLCLVSHSKLHFELKINLYKQINAEGAQGENHQFLNSELKNDGVGTQSVILQKKQHEIWPFLNKQETIYQIWIQIAERYPNDTTKFQQIFVEIMKEKRAKTSKGQLFISCILLALGLLLAV